jgi:hypothetical protein
MSARSDAFVKCWVSENVFNVPGLTDSGAEVAWLRAKLLANARRPAAPRAMAVRSGKAPDVSGVL